eukprot:2885443-Prymnesium_polylepis.1
MPPKGMTSAFKGKQAAAADPKQKQMADGHRVGAGRWARSGRASCRVPCLPRRRRRKSRCRS